MIASFLNRCNLCKNRCHDLRKMRISGRRERTAIEKFHSPKRTNSSRIGTTSLPRTPSFTALAIRNLTTVLAGILIFCCVLGLKPVRAFLFCFTSLPKPGRTNSPVFLISLYASALSVSRILQRFFCSSRWQQRVRLEVQSWSCLALAYGSGMASFQENRVRSIPFFAILIDVFHCVKSVPAC